MVPPLTVYIRYLLYIQSALKGGEGAGTRNHATSHSDLGRTLENMRMPFGPIQRSQYLQCLRRGRPEDRNNRAGHFPRTASTPRMKGRCRSRRPRSSRRSNCSRRDVFRPLLSSMAPGWPRNSRHDIQCCQMANFDPFLSLDCARVEGKFCSVV